MSGIGSKRKGEAEACSGVPADAAADLPRILEVKRTLGGAEKRFECAVLAREGAHVVVLFVSPVAMQVHDVALPAGTVTFGHFWTDRPYNVYHWMKGGSGETIGYYFNLAGETRIDEGRLEWLDLVVDVLALPGGRITVLDEDEVPPTIPDELRSRIAAAKAEVLRAPADLAAELERQRRALWPRLAAGAPPAGRVT